MDRSYWNAPQSKTWHAADFANLNDAVDARSYCGLNPAEFWVRDRVPAAGHLCGNCSRSIAARTDIEGSLLADAPFQRAMAREGMASSPPVDDVPEPVVSEQDDSV